MYQTIIYLNPPSPEDFSNLPEPERAAHRFCLGLASDGVYRAGSVATPAVVSYTAFPPLPDMHQAVYFCCTGLGVASTGCYPASCPVKPGLSSAGHAGSDRLSYSSLQLWIIAHPDMFGYRSRAFLTLPFSHMCASQPLSQSPADICRAACLSYHPQSISPYHDDPRL